MATVNPYLIFNGQCEAAFNLYKTVFGKEFNMISKFGDMPNDGSYTLPEEEKNKVMHVALPISNETILMGSDSNSKSGNVQLGDNISVSINCNSKEEADNIFEGLVQGGKIKMPMEKTFWGAYFGMLTDIFGINWMINFDFK